jgi:hypothetical protein
VCPGSFRINDHGRTVLDMSEASVALLVVGIAILLLWPYWLSPVRFYREQRRRPSLNLSYWLTDLASVPAPARELFEDTASQLDAAGFQPLQPIRAVGGGLTKFMRHYVHPDRPELVTAIYMAVPRREEQTKVVIATVHADGSDWRTSNNAHVRLLPLRLSRTFRVRAVPGPLEMLELHRQFVRDSGSPAIPFTARDPIALAGADARRARAMMLASGWFEPHNDNVVPTRFGAFLVMWMNLPPWRTWMNWKLAIRRRRYERALATARPR